MEEFGDSFSVLSSICSFPNNLHQEGRATWKTKYRAEKKPHLEIIHRPPSGRSLSRRKKNPYFLKSEIISMTI